jgi:hypothetical protein
MSNGISPASVEAGTTNVRSSAGNPRAAARARQGRLWRALGGMLLAIALGVTVVMMEIHAQLRIHARVHQRLTLEQSKVIQLQQAVASANRAIAVEDSALIAQEKFNEILLTPDNRLIHFEKGTPTLLGIIVINQRLKVAAVEISGAKMANQVAELWWMPRQGKPIASDQLRFDDRGRAITFVNLTPSFGHMKSVLVLLQSHAYDSDQTTKMLLKADLSSVAGSH